MKELIIKGNEIELRLEVGNARGSYYYVNGKMYLKAKTRWDLAELTKYKNEIENKLK